MGMPEESQPIDYRKDVIMKKHRIISIALSVIGFAATLALVLYLLKDRTRAVLSAETMLPMRQKKISSILTLTI